MHRRTRQLKAGTLCLVTAALLISLFIPHTPASAFSPQVIQRGATGDDVIELQARLQYIGYYKGRINGVFGWETYWAVRNFQHDFGLDIDGLVGNQMKEKLLAVTEFDKDYVYGKLAQGENPRHFGPKEGPEGLAPPGQRDPGNLDKVKWVPPGTHGKEPPRAKEPAEQPRQPEAERAPRPPAETPAQPAPPEAPPAEGQVGQLEQAVNIPQGFSENDIRLMANAVYGEARGEPYEGQVAVAAVILNRVRSPEFPNTVSGVIFEPLAFTAVMDGQIWLEPNETARRAVMDAINGWDPTGGVVYYFNPATARAPWMWERYGEQRDQSIQIGKHIFLK
ncbi:N-acetylmuramoyl-L-alanine amidase [Caldalkalibacillus uzonensis]|uniref:Spore cortex-lytic enzyme n=1 Tax=Caldalkalibacillus uzonensis TaxID=353224 RepID=A0ABU0CNN7_9BACI|nr:spore cortex-lytic enzyme [Caldalkalibacillus uzonensis]MDQ0337767.1 N-acetylmuramoyl-L-alanine amidase [Caldalkalibacillus uzonensis]